jgi:hypothetical protein
MAAHNRKAFIEFVATWVDKILPGGGNGAYLTERFNAMSDAELSAYVARLVSGEEIIPLTAPNLAKEKLSVERNMALIKQLGKDIFHHLRLTDSASGITYVTPEKYLVMKLSVRRQRQLLRKKITIPEGVRHVDEFSGQVTGPSKGSRISLPELQVLYSQDLTDPIVELIKYRGGDVKGQQLMYRSLMETGRVSMRNLDRFNTRVKSTDTLGVILQGMMLSNTLNT